MGLEASLCASEVVTSVSLANPESGTEYANFKELGISLQAIHTKMIRRIVYSLHLLILEDAVGESTAKTEMRIDNGDGMSRA